MANHSFRDLRAVAVPAFGPTLLGSVGSGAVVPVIALTARELGASVGVAALMVALLGLGQLLADLPAGALAARFGERRVLLGASVSEFVGGLGCLLARNVPELAASIMLIGVSGAAFGLARQSYLTGAIPVELRARALSTLGGVSRIGMFLGPFLGAAVIARTGVQGAYAVDMVASVGAFLVVACSRDLSEGRPDPGAPTRTESVFGALWRHRAVLRTLGVGALLIALVRACRTVIVPLWAVSIGLDAVHASLVFGLAGAVDMLLFYPAGAVMDRRGRLMVALPSMLLLGLGLILIVFTHAFGGLLAVAVLLGVANGIGSGMVMTLGADASPSTGRAQFLGGWRLMADAGSAAGPLLISLISLAFPLAVASVCMGGLALVGAGWLRVWVPRHDPITAAGPAA